MTKAKLEAKIYALEARAEKLEGENANHTAEITALYREASALRDRAAKLAR